MSLIKRIVALAALLCISLPSVVAGPKSEEAIPAGIFDFQGVSIPQVLVIYKELTGANLCVDSRARNTSAQIVCKNKKPASKAEVIKMIETALLEQAAIIVTKLESNKVSVTFNDSLPVKPVDKKDAK
ncbi:MAG TPA: hypothetical protein VN673_12005 [Clostridia bacterium]|nr:hypothetical protein [Clostridia bacterium]